MDGYEPVPPPAVQNEEVSSDTSEGPIDANEILTGIGPVTLSPLRVQPASSVQEMSANRRAMVRQLYEIQAIKQARPENTQGNVLAIVNFPQNAGPSCDGTPWTNYQQRISYDKLVATGSSKLLALLSPRKQASFRRRLGQTTLPQGIEYILDLTPLDESDDHANITCALWLPESTKIWWLAGHYESTAVLTSGPQEFAFNARPDVDKAVGAVLALGHDDVCKRRFCTMDDTIWSVQGAHGIYEPGPADEPIPDYRKIDDYCPIRHRVAIIRLIRAIDTGELLINSATRMWTLSQMAIHLDLTDVVRDQVAQWFMAPPNSKFIEMFPEESFRIAYGLQLRNVLVSAFQIMVNEFAIDVTSSRVPEQRSSGGKRSTTWSERKRGDYGDYPQDPIEFAGRAFADRISTQLAALRSNQCLDSLGIALPEWDKLKSINNLLADHLASDSPVKLACERLVTGLIDTFQQSVSHALVLGHPVAHTLALLNAQRAHYLSSRSAKSFRELYHALNDCQKAMTPFFWTELLASLQSPIYSAKSSNGTPIATLVTGFNNRFRSTIKAHTIPMENMTKYILDLPGHETEFSLLFFIRELEVAAAHLHNRILSRNNEIIQMVLSDHLILKLDEEELKFLPMWAGGLDDGSGGVFQEPVPNTDMGPSEPGPAYHTGYTSASTDNDMASVTFSGVDSELGHEIANLDLDDATVARSMDAHGSISTTPAANHNRVLIAESVASEQFNSDMGDFSDAMYAQPADHQVHGQALVAHVENPEDHPMDYTIEEDDEDDAFSQDSDSTIGGSDFDMV